MKRRRRTTFIVTWDPKKEQTHTQKKEGNKGRIRTVREGLSQFWYVVSYILKMVDSGKIQLDSRLTERSK